MYLLQRSSAASLINSLNFRIVDIGARGGIDEDLLDIAWACEVYGFEPEPAEAERLRKSMDRRWKAVNILPYAVGSVCGQGTLFVPEAEEGASLLKHNPAMVDRFGHPELHITRREIPVETITLDALFEASSLPRADYLKIDIEGAELGVLEAGSSVLDNCSILKIECSFLEQRVSQPLMWDVAHFMSKKGFDLADIRDIHHWRRRSVPAHPYVSRFDMPYSRGQLAQCDLIFLRQPNLSMDTEALARLSVLSAAFGYFDYAVGVLRGAPSVAAFVAKHFNLELEAELKKWSAGIGRRNLCEAIRNNLQSLIRQLRSLFGVLSYGKPIRPY